MPWKVNEEGNVVTADGKPVFVHPDGKELPFDGDVAVGKISALGKESKEHREAKEAAEASLSIYKALGEVDEVAGLVDRAKKIDAKKLIDAGQVDQFKADWERGWNEKLSNIEKQKQSLENELFEAKVGSKFAESDFVRDKLMIGPVMARTAFGSYFKLEDGQAIGYHKDGNKITSRERFGEPAGFDEALEQILQGHPERDRLIRDPSSVTASNTSEIIANKSIANSHAKPPAKVATTEISAGQKPEDALTEYFQNSMKDLQTLHPGITGR